MREIEALSKPLPRYAQVAVDEVKRLKVKNCLFVRTFGSGTRVIDNFTRQPLGTIMPQVSDSRQQPKSLAHKLMEKRNQS